MGIFHGGKGIFRFPTRFLLFRTRPFCSSSQNNKPTTINSSSNKSENASSSLSKYDEQYKALSNLDFVSAAKILFQEPANKKKFGLDFHLVQLFFVCLPSLAVYLVAQYARSEMRKMDAELEKKKQTEFEAQAKEMERKAAEEKAAVSSNPEILEVKERLDKIEETIKQIVVESKEKFDDSQKDGSSQSIKAADVKPDNVSQESRTRENSKDSTIASIGGKTRNIAAVDRGSPNLIEWNQKWRGLSGSK